MKGLSEFIFETKWNHDTCKEEAKKFRNRSEFRQCSASAYKVARENGWLDEYDWMDGNRNDQYKDLKDCVYVYEFTELKSVYVGRTLMSRLKERDKEHSFKEKDAVVIFAKENNVSVPKIKIIETDLALETASKKENELIENYKKDGWNIINRERKGSIGKLGK